MGWLVYHQPRSGFGISHQKGILLDERFAPYNTTPLRCTPAPAQNWQTIPLKSRRSTCCTRLFTPPLAHHPSRCTCGGESARSHPSIRPSVRPSVGCRGQIQIITSEALMGSTICRLMTDIHSLCVTTGLNMTTSSYYLKTSSFSKPVHAPVRHGRPVTFMS